MNIVNDILVNTLFPDTDFVQTLSMNSVVPKYVENQEKGNPSVCKNCADAPFRDLHIYGRSEQVTTTGAQLFVSKKTRESNFGVTLTQKDDGGWHLEGTNTADDSRNIRLLEPTEYFTLPSGDYTLSFTGDIPNSVTLNIVKVANVHKKDEKWTFLGNINKNKKNIAISLDGTEEALSMYVIFPAQVALSFDFYVMLNAGSSALPWEPYTGGKPSPSPEYPQEIVNAGKDGNLNVTVRGKNVFAGRFYYARYSNGILFIDKRQKDEEVKFPYQPKTEATGICKALKCQKGKTYIFSVTNPNKNAAIGMAEYENIEKTINTNNALGFVNVYDASEKSYTAKSDGILVCGIAGKWTNGSTTTHECTESELLQVEEASEATSYEPYHEPQSMSVTTPNGLPGIPVTSGGNYTDENGQQWICDEVDLGRGVYVQRIASFVINAKNANDISVTNLYTHVTVAVNARIRTPEETSNSLEMRRNRNLFCEALPWTADEWSSTVNSMGFVENSAVDFTVENSYLGLSEASTNDERKAALVKYFTDKPCQIVYRIATPIETPLTASEIAAYKVLRTYRGTTIVEAEDKAGISVKYNMPMPELSKNGALRRWFKRHPII